jgi:hypothetical protein
MRETSGVGYGISRPYDMRTWAIGHYTTAAEGDQGPSARIDRAVATFVFPGRCFGGLDMVARTFGIALLSA